MIDDDLAGHAELAFAQAIVRGTFDPDDYDECSMPTPAAGTIRALEKRASLLAA